MRRKNLRVAACQMQFGEDIEGNAARIAAQLKACATQKVDVAAFQEGALLVIPTALHSGGIWIGNGW